MAQSNIQHMADRVIDNAATLADRYRAVREQTCRLLAPLSDADATLQSMEDASPAKWHLGHTTWFFETFLLRDHVPGYSLYDDRFPFLFNSYYEAEGERINRFSRGMLSQPTVSQICEWRSAVDAAVAPMLEDPACADVIALGIAHEQQHQELLLTDIKHALFQNPLGPAMYEAPVQSGSDRVHGEADIQPAQENPNDCWMSYPGGTVTIGHRGRGFAFDNEGPSHQVLLSPFALSPRLVTNGEWQEFIAAGGYKNPALWLADGWAWVMAEAITEPLYWYQDTQFSHYGWLPRDPDAPVTHISYFEADAFAAWAGARLPTEVEWEAAAQDYDPTGGNQLDERLALLPQGGASLFGDCWQFTRSAYLPYPRFVPAAGAVGEYNGKFMSGQVVLRGASCATPRGHSRSSYRNFFYPHQRWQYTGLRLAKDI